MIPVLWGDPGIKALLEAPPLCCGVFQRVGAAPWIFSHWDVSAGKSWTAPALSWLPGNENSPNLGQVWGGTRGSPRAAPLPCPGIPSRNSQSGSWGSSPLLRSLGDVPAWVQLSLGINPEGAGRDSRNFHPLLPPRHFGRGKILFVGFGLCSFFPTRGRAWIGGNIRRLLLSPRKGQGCTKCCQSIQGTAKGILIPAARAGWVYSCQEVTEGAPSSPGILGGVPGWDRMGFQVSSSPNHSVIPAVNAPGGSSEFPRDKSQCPGTPQLSGLHRLGPDLLQLLGCKSR